MNLKNNERWEATVEAAENSQDPVSLGSVQSARAVMEALDNGATVEAARNLMFDHNLTRTMPGAVAGIITECHERGEEFRIFWNKSFGVESKVSAFIPDFPKFTMECLPNES